MVVCPSRQGLGGFVTLQCGMRYGAAEQVDATTGKSKTGMVKSAEDIQVDQVRLMGDGPGKPLLRVGIKLRYDRRPIIGDKFSSRHGQKGVLSTLWPAHNMPFSENGIIPDVIINPNAFPSRMTIGMLVESMAGKSGAMHGFFPDSTPFRFDEENRAVDYFGHQLKEAGPSPRLVAACRAPPCHSPRLHSNCWSACGLRFRSGKKRREGVVTA